MPSVIIIVGFLKKNCYPTRLISTLFTWGLILFPSQVSNEHGLMMKTIWFLWVSKMENKMKMEVRVWWNFYGEEIS
jgi:hypothetical protein